MSNLTKFVPAGIQKVVGRAGLKLGKVSPHLLVGLGIVGVVGGVVLACKATLHVEEVLDDAKDKLDEVNDNLAEAEEMDLNYTEKDASHDRMKIYVGMGFDLVKLYLPSVALLGLGLGSFIGSHNIMTKRNAALLAAYKLCQENFDDYRKRVVEEFGSKKDYMFKNGLYEEEVTETETDEEGNEHEVAKKVVTHRDGYSQYARFFDEASPMWMKSADMNLAFLKAQEQYWNDILRCRGHVFLNEVYDELGIPRSTAGAIVGWVYNPEGGEHQIDFGIFRDINDEVRRDFVNGYTNAILLDFNVTGVIYDLI